MFRVQVERESGQGASVVIMIKPVEGDTGAGRPMDGQALNILITQLARFPYG